jgi:hypothetical protein
MASISELHKAIQKGQFALVKKLATQLRNDGIDISSEVEFAKKVYKINGGAYKLTLDAILEE